MGRAKCEMRREASFAQAYAFISSWVGGAVLLLRWTVKYRGLSAAALRVFGRDDVSFWGVGEKGGATSVWLPTVEMTCVLLWVRVARRFR